MSKKYNIHTTKGNKDGSFSYRGRGFIGTHTCVELLDAGEEIIVVDNLVNSKIESLDRGLVY